MIEVALALFATLTCVALYRKIGRVLEQRNAKLAASIIDEARHD